MHSLSSATPCTHAQETPRESARSLPIDERTCKWVLGLLPEKGSSSARRAFAEKPPREERRRDVVFLKSRARPADTPPSKAKSLLSAVQNTNRPPSESGSLLPAERARERTRPAQEGQAPRLRRSRRLE